LGRKTMPAFIDMHKQKACDSFCDEKNCAFQGCYTVCNGNSSPTFQYNQSVPSSRVKNPRR
jgi:N-acyl-D-aspartate/D-glutamate deacylase